MIREKERESGGVIWQRQKYRKRKKIEIRIVIERKKERQVCVREIVKERKKIMADRDTK